MIRARRSEKQRLGFWRHTRILSGEQQVADRLGGIAAAGLASEDAIDAAHGKCRMECLQLGRLADPFSAFERDEASGRAHAMPNSCLRPIQARPKKPACSTASPATSGMTCSPSGMATTRSAMCWPLAIGAFTGPL